ncbi:hypothetical protein LTR85_007488 [Meristemomyces frigidus]|nr:hypothetical protein LTR85_007488 [Meristemomyces frigidus]
MASATSTGQAKKRSHTIAFVENDTPELSIGQRVGAAEKAAEFTSPYTYEALCDNEIRVLDIASARSIDDPVECSIRTTRLHPASTTVCTQKNALLRKPRAKADARNYAAMSYAWGETSPDGSHLTDEIRCNGKTMRVTSNLHLALRRIRQKMDEVLIDKPPPTDDRSPEEHPERQRRHHAKHLSLWIDAICINQESLQERSAQVQRMADIYRQSQRLIVWLGETQMGYDGARLREALGGKKFDRSVENAGLRRHQARHDERRADSKRFAGEGAPTVVAIDQLESIEQLYSAPAQENQLSLSRGSVGVGALAPARVPSSPEEYAKDDCGENGNGYHDADGCFCAGG